MSISGLQSYTRQASGYQILLKATILSNL